MKYTPRPRLELRSSISDIQKGGVLEWTGLPTHIIPGCRLFVERFRNVQFSIIGLIFVAVTLVCGMAYWYVDKKMVFTIESLKDLYKLCLIIIYATQLVLIFIFLF